MLISTFHALFSTDNHRLGYYKFCARLVPKMLTGAHKTQRMASALTLLERISQSHRTSNRWWNLGFIYEYWNERAAKTVDAHTFSKQAETVWTNVVCLPESWWQLFPGTDRKVVLRVEFMQQETTVTSQVYRETLKKKNCVGPFRAKGEECWHPVLLHDNARPHAAARTRALLKYLNWEMFDHPSYSPDLAPSDYHVLTYLKNWLRLQCFSINEHLMEGVTWLSSQAADFFDTGI
jgi:hypothetical protein